MLNIEYDIKLNDLGRPYIELSDDYVDKPEDKFLAIELTRYILQNAYMKKGDEFDDNTSIVIENCLNFLGQIGDEISQILLNQMKTMGEVSLMFNSKYHVQVSTIKDLYGLGVDNIIYNGKVYKRENGLKVLVLDEMKIYMLDGGTDNNNWIEI